MLQVIVRAIRERELLAFVYGSFTRVAEPYAVGESVTGNNVLWAFQLSAEHLAIHHGISHYPVLGSIGLGYEWDVFELSQMSGLHSVGKHFIGERYGYKRDNKHMTAIFAQV